MLDTFIGIELWVKIRKVGSLISRWNSIKIFTGQSGFLTFTDSGGLDTDILLSDQY